MSLYCKKRDIDMLYRGFSWLEKIVFFRRNRERQQTTNMHHDTFSLTTKTMMPPTSPNSQLGFQARLFDKKTTACDEIRFASKNNFDAIQFRGPEQGLDRQYLGDELAVVADTLYQAAVSPTLELLIGLEENGHTPSGLSPIDVMNANLAAIKTLSIRHVHWHLYPMAFANMNAATARPLEQAVVPAINKAVSLSQEHGFVFGIENNSPEALLFTDPAACQEILNQVPGLKLVWDLNHTRPQDLAGFQKLAPHIGLLHVSDTRLPSTNDHLPLGLGNIDFTAYLKTLHHSGYSGPAILEIGGLPQSGGFGRDTDAALSASRHQLQSVL
jgi:L-ribulose-5-phosphate 3-epimerase